MNAETPRTPVLVELFTSEGCSSCPPADHLLEVLDRNQPIAGADTIVLSEHVDYWNRLGWPDPFSSAQFSARQQEYAGKIGHSGSYTPQMVVDGRFEFVGSDGRQASAAIQDAAKQPKANPVIRDVKATATHVTARIEVPMLENVQRRTRPVLFVAIADNSAESNVKRGENGGRVLRHVAVVRTLSEEGSIQAGKSAAREVSLPFHQMPGGSRLVAFIQDAASGRVLGVAQVRIEESL